MADDASYTLLASKGCGSVTVEAALALSGLPHRVEEIPHDEPGPARDRLRAFNPLGQVPVLLPDGAVMTESAAMVLHLADRAPGAALAPTPEDPTRPAFLRWLVFLVGAIYPSFTYGDDPARYVSGEAARTKLRAGTDGYCQRCWRIMEAAVAPAPWVLGRQFSALDLYVSAMTRWRCASTRIRASQKCGLATTAERSPAGHWAIHLHLRRRWCWPAAVGWIRA